MRSLLWMMFAIVAMAVMGAPAHAQSDRGEAPEGPPTVAEVPVAIDPPLAASDTTPLRGVVWSERPTGQDFARNYPPEALRAHIGGRALLDCLIAADGRLSCNVLSEEPEGAGFGAASLAVARSFRAAPELGDGTPTAGRRTRVPIRWVLR